MDESPETRMKEAVLGLGGTERLTLPLAGPIAYVVLAAYQIDIQLDESEGRIRLEAPFTLTDEWGAVTIDPGPSELDRNTVEGIGRVYPLARKILKVATVDAQYDLELLFEGGVVLRVSRIPQYEAWEAHGVDATGRWGLLASPK